MKTFAVILLCAFAAVHGRSGVVKSTRTEAAPGEKPWVVHLRNAVSTSGLLTSCVGTLIDSQWVLTTATCLKDTRFIWIRYGATKVFNPELVTENSAVRIHSTFDVALISINRIVHSTANISPAAMATKDAVIPADAVFCAYGDDGANGPGEKLGCFNMTLEVQDGGVIAGHSVGDKATQYDIGAPLVVDGVQYGILVSGADDENDAKFIAVSEVLDWIVSETGMSLGNNTNHAVHFVN